MSRKPEFFFHLDISPTLIRAQKVIYLYLLFKFVSIFIIFTTY